MSQSSGLNVTGLAVAAAGVTQALLMNQVQAVAAEVRWLGRVFLRMLCLQRLT